MLKIYDELGLFLRVQPIERGGTAAWCVRTRIKLPGDDRMRERLYGAGGWPEVSLAQARDRRDKLLDDLRAGLAPKTRRDVDAFTGDGTFWAAATDWLERQRLAGRADSTLRKMDWMVNRLLVPRLGKLQLDDVTSDRVLAAVREIETSGKVHSARRALTIVGRIMRASNKPDPTAGLRENSEALLPERRKNRPAITDHKRLGELLRAIHKYAEEQPVVGLAWKLLFFTMVRPGELRQARWDQFDFERKLWTLPAAVMKARREHTVCLSSYAIAVLEQLKAITGSGELLFPGIRSPKRPISDMTLAAALARMGFTSDEHTPHGTRASTASLAGKCGWPPDIVEPAQSRVKSGGPVRSIYDRDDRLDGRRALAEWLGLALEAIRLELEIPEPEWWGYRPPRES